MKAILIPTLLIAMLGAGSARANSSIPLLYCQDLPTDDLEVVEVSVDDQGTEILSRYRDGKTATTRLGTKMQIDLGTRISLPSSGLKQREFLLKSRGWVLRVSDRDSSDEMDVFCD